MNTGILDLRIWDAAFDEPDPGDASRQHLFLCTSPRTGSHRLMRALYDVGLGVPSEYFHPASVAHLGARWQVPTDMEQPGNAERYWRQVERHRTRNGIVATSLFGSQIRFVKQVLTPDTRASFIHLYRRDIAGQIASLLALYQTKQPFENAQEVAGIPGIQEISE